MRMPNFLIIGTPRSGTTTFYKVWDVILGEFRQRNLRKPELQTEMREWLIEYYRDDILRTQDILRCDLSHRLERPVRTNKNNPEAS